ncbi:MAG: hypothetical protein HC910_08560 [Spirulinaceae cyanobacterium SM2_1_0]|nr:hypothetical protein [Spirulinaceae cyanobacterium SM2_1_0]
MAEQVSRQHVTSTPQTIAGVGWAQHPLLNAAEPPLPRLQDGLGRCQGS